MKQRIPTKKYRHPLTEIVLTAFAQQECWDAIKLADYLGAPNRPAKGLRAYTIVAEDILGVLVADGLLVIDGQGWHRAKASYELDEEPGP